MASLTVNKMIKKLKIQKISNNLGIRSDSSQFEYFRIPNGWWKLCWNRCLQAFQMFSWMYQHRTVSKCYVTSQKILKKSAKNSKFWRYCIASLPKLFNLFFAILSIRVNPDQTWITWPLHVQHSNMEKVEWPTDANVQLDWFYLKERITISAYSRLYFSNAIRPGCPG